MKGSPVHIEDATAADVCAIGALRAASWRAAYQGIVAQKFLDTMSGQLPTSLADRIPAAPHEVALVVRDTVGGVVGFSIARASVEPEVGELYLLYVDARCWNRGIGGALLAATEDKLARLGFAEAILWTFSANTPAHVFYARAGWHADGGTGGWHVGGHYVPEVRFRRSLSALRDVSPRPPRADTGGPRQADR